MPVTRMRQWIVSGGCSDRACRRLYRPSGRAGILCAMRGRRRVDREKHRPKLAPLRQRRHGGNESRRRHLDAGRLQRRAFGGFVMLDGKRRRRSALLGRWRSRNFQNQRHRCNRDRHHRLRRSRPIKPDGWRRTAQDDRVQTQRNHPEVKRRHRDFKSETQHSPLRSTRKAKQPLIPASSPAQSLFLGFSGLAVGAAPPSRPGHVPSPLFKNLRLTSRWKYQSHPREIS